MLDAPEGCGSIAPGISGYGSPRTWKDMVAHGARLSKGRVRKLVVQHGVRLRYQRKHIATMNSNHTLPAALRAAMIQFPASPTGRSPSTSRISHPAKRSTSREFAYADSQS